MSRPYCPASILGQQGFSPPLNDLSRSFLANARNSSGAGIQHHLEVLLSLLDVPCSLQEKAKPITFCSSSASLPRARRLPAI
jgi:hypothetical protein